MRTLAVISVIIAAHSPMQVYAAAGSEGPEVLIRRWNAAQVVCRTARNEDQLGACAPKFILGGRLSQLGYCWGREDEPMALHNWHRCGPHSIPYGE